VAQAAAVMVDPALEVVEQLLLARQILAVVLEALI
jgi:hypothetical protein